MSDVRGGGDGPTLTVVPGGVTGDGDAVVDLVDPVLGAWLVRLEPVHDTSLVAGGVPTSVLALAQAVLDGAPAVSTGQAGAIRVVFSPDVRRRLADGSLQLMGTGASTLRPVAVDPGSGRVVAQAAVAGGAAAGVGAMAPVLLPIALGAAAAWAQQRWLEETFAEVQASLSRIELRLRDDDLGELEAASELVDLLTPSVTSGRVPNQLRYELAQVHHEVNRIYRSRRRFVERFKAELERWQNDHQRRKGEVTPWAGGVADELGDRKTGIGQELVLFVQALITRARVEACLAGVLAADGDTTAALALVDRLDTGLRDDFLDLHRRVRALATYGPERTWWSKVPGLPPGKAEEALEFVQLLDGEMRAKIGDRLPDPDDQLAVVVPLRPAS